MAITTEPNKLVNSWFTTFIVCLFVLGTVIYIFPVGRIQPGHYLAIFIILVGLSFIRFHTLKLTDQSLIVFGLYVLVVNGYYFLTNGHPEFFTSIVYWGYNIALFIALCHIFQKSNFLQRLIPYVFVACFLAFLFLWLLGYLRTDLSTLRFLAQFNDPNQMGHWLICGFIALVLLAKVGFLSNRYVQTILILVVALLISATGSRSAMFGFAPLLIGFIWLRFFRDQVKISKPVLLALISLFIVATFYILSAQVNKHIVAPTQEAALANEVPLNRIKATEWALEAKRRGYYRPIEYPQYLLFGAGHGDEARFNSPYEIHASLLGVFFYYGIVGFTLFIFFLYQIFRRLSLPEAVMLSAPFVYGFFTYGLRTPIFWVLMAIIVATRPLPDEGNANDLVSKD